MGQKTSIEWTGSTWNPIRARLPETITLQQIGGAKQLEAGRWGYHCEHVSAGCKNCYAEAMNKRTLPAWGTGLAFNVPNRSRVEIFLDEKELVKPLHWKSPTKIFPCSMTDWCAEFVPDEFRDRMIEVCAATPQHTYQFLTKRAKEQHAYFTERVTVGGRLMYQQPPSWIHLGVSVEDQPNADKRIPHLLRTPAAVRWVSYEPALGPVDFTRLRPEGCSGWIDAIGKREHRGPSVFDVEVGLDWIVAGGESGPGARPMHPDWIRSVRDQCQAAGVAFFFKQWGGWAPTEMKAGGDLGGDVRRGRTTIVRAPGNPDGYFRRGDAWMSLFGKKSAGRLLDGRTWDEMPDIAQLAEKENTNA